MDIESTSKVKTVPDTDPRWQRCRDGDREARNSLIADHQPLLDQVAGSMLRKFPPHVEFEEIRSYGVFGLIKAVETYDPERATFRTHAVLQIRSKIYDELRVQDWAPKTFRDKVKETEKTAKKLSAELGREPTTDEVGAALGRDGVYVRSLQQAVKSAHHKSLDEMGVVSGDMTTLPALSTPSGLVENSVEASDCLQQFAEWAAVSLSDEERAVWALRFYLGWSLLQIGRHLEIRRSEASRILERVLRSFQDFVRTLRQSNVAC